MMWWGPTLVSVINLQYLCKGSIRFLFNDIYAAWSVYSSFVLFLSVALFSSRWIRPFSIAKSFNSRLVILPSLSLVYRLASPYPYHLWIKTKCPFTAETKGKEQPIVTSTYTRTNDKRMCSSVNIAIIVQCLCVPPTCSYKELGVQPKQVVFKNLRKASIS